VIYSGNTAKEKLDSKADPFLARVVFGSRSTVRRRSVKQAGRHGGCGKYSGDGRVAGVDSACDVNTYDGPIDQLVAEWSGGAPAPAPETQTITITITAPKDATINVVTA